MAEIPPAYRKSINQNYFCPGEQLQRFGGRTESPEMTRALGGRRWGEVNAEVGGETTLLEEGAFLLRFIPIYLESFFNLKDNLPLRLISNLFTGGTDGLEGMRDQKMYGEAYGHGVDEMSELNMDKDDLLDDSKAIGKLGYADDWLQNERERMYGEDVVATVGAWSRQTAKVKPIAHFVSGFLGSSWRNLIQTGLDFFPRIWWRLRFLTVALHSNSVTSMCDLVKSPFTGEFSNVSRKLGKMADQYFINKNGKKHKTDKNAGLVLYFSMYLDRMKDHCNAIIDPKAALLRKCKDGFLTRVTDAEREQDPNKSLAQGYVNPNSKEDQNEQRRLALTDFTGPICAIAGLLGTVVISPVKIILDLCGVEKGKNIWSALDASRKSFSLLNYVFRFVMDEYNQGNNYKDLEKYMKNGKPNKAISELYHARLARRTNAVIGGIMAATNIVEPLLWLGQSEENTDEPKGIWDFCFKSFLSFNNVFFLRFFSKRREVQGRLHQLQGIAKEALGLDYVRDEDYLNLKDEDYNQAMKKLPSRARDNKQGNFLDTLISGFTGLIETVKAKCTGEEKYPHYNLAA